MPQITVNEIDQSVVTRVVKDDRVKILIPAILSFGPPALDVYNSTDQTLKTKGDVMTFTDVSDFNRGCGYTPAEFNPFLDDHSRTYARELLKRGASVSVVRVNTNGDTASFDIGPASRTTPSYDTICKAVFHSIADSDKIGYHNSQDSGAVTNITVTWDQTDPNIGTATISAAYETQGSIAGKIIPGSLQITENSIVYTDDGNGVIKQGGTGTVFGNINYSTGVITNIPKSLVNTDKIDEAQFDRIKSDSFWKYTFCPQIDSIEAKWHGSFGNNLFISIAQLDTTRLAQSFQYANVSVYYLDRTINYEEIDGQVVIKSQTVNNVTMLETRRISTNPNDPDYFGNVEFDFIRINPTANAEEELNLVWSNINNVPQVAEQYSGFPVITLKYTGSNGLTSYNFDCNFNKTFGTDFPYSNGTPDPSKNMVAKLKTGFKGYIAGEGDSHWSDDDVAEYKSEVYGDGGIIADIYGKIAAVYQNFTDPYIYDFDFITSGGFVYTEYNSNGVETYPGASHIYSRGITPIHAQMINLVETRQDCIALFDVPATYDPRTNLIEYSRILNTSYGTMHFPWCYVADPDVSGNMLLMAPSYIFLYTFLSNLDNNVDSQKWFPPAGVKRATARVVKKPYFEMGSVLLNIWQNDYTARVNPIMKLKQYGYVIYGQYTCLPAIDMFTHSALESLNVRLISNVVKKKIFDVCLNLAFEPNTETLWLKFYSQMDEFLRYMKYNEGLYEYKIVMDESTVTTDDINHLRCPGKVYIAPTRTAEFFDIDFIITEAGALFNN